MGMVALGAAVAGLASGLGVFARGDGSFQIVTSVRGVTYEMATNGVYAFNSRQLVAEGIGWDVFTLFVAVPATLATMSAAVAVRIYAGIRRQDDAKTSPDRAASELAPRPSHG